MNLHRLDTLIGHARSITLNGTQIGPSQSEIRLTNDRRFDLIELDHISGFSRFELREDSLMISTMLSHQTFQNMKLALGEGTLSGSTLMLGIQEAQEHNLTIIAVGRNNLGKITRREYVFNRVVNIFTVSEEIERTLDADETRSYEVIFEILFDETKVLGDHFGQVFDIVTDYRSFKIGSNLTFFFSRTLDSSGKVGAAYIGDLDTSYDKSGNTWHLTNFRLMASILKVVDNSELISSEYTLYFRQGDNESEIENESNLPICAGSSIDDVLAHASYNASKAWTQFIIHYKRGYDFPMVGQTSILLYINGEKT